MVRPSFSSRRNSGQVAQSRHQVGVGEQHPGRPLVRPEDADRPARLHQHRLVVLERGQRPDQRVVARPVAGGLAGAAVDDQVLRALGDVRVQVVLQHPHRGLLRPALRGDRRAPGGPDRVHYSSFSSGVYGTKTLRRAAEASNVFEPGLSLCRYGIADGLQQHHRQRHRRGVQIEDEPRPTPARSVTSATSATSPIGESVSATTASPAARASRSAVHRLPRITRQHNSQHRGRAGRARLFQPIGEQASTMIEYADVRQHLRGEVSEVTRPAARPIGAPAPEAAGWRRAAWPPWRRRPDRVSRRRAVRRAGRRLSISPRRVLKIIWAIIAGPRRSPAVGSGSPAAAPDSRRNRGRWRTG